MKTIYLSAFLAAFVFILPGCKKTGSEAGECNGITSANPTAVSGPSTGTINTDNAFAVTVALIDGCKSFNSFDEARTGNTVNITCKVNSNGCICTAIYGEVTGAYNFRAATPGTYTINFLFTNGSVMTKTIVIS